jgi:NDP-sugar pyrophosphorylase family protein
MVLAAGRGTRLGAMAKVTPKPMIPLAGKPILEHTLQWLQKSGIRDVVINLHHQGEQIRSYFADGSSWGLRLVYSAERSLRGTAGALLPVRDHFTETFLVVYGDNFFDCDFARLIVAHRRRGGIGTMVLHERADAAQSGMARLDRDSRIIEFVEKPGEARTFGRLVNAGLLVLEPTIFEHIPPDRPSDFSYEIIPRLLRARVPLYGYVMREPEFVLGVDTPSDYASTRVRAAERSTTR